MDVIHRLLGLTCDDVRHDLEVDQWCFAFQERVSLQVTSTWRIVAKGEIVLARDDNGQKFGRSAPILAAIEARPFLIGSRVSKFSVAPDTADLRLDFESGARLEVFNDSSGYEAWQFNAPEGLVMVAQGGGKLVKTTR